MKYEPRTPAHKNLEKTIRTNFSISMTLEQEELINKAARKAGMMRSRWTLETLLKEAGK